MPAAKLTDVQLVLLSAAAQHSEGAIELSPDLKGSATKKIVGKLLRGGLNSGGPVNICWLSRTVDLGQSRIAAYLTQWEHECR
jgi:hypothetical protein